MPRSLDYLARCQRDGQAVIGSSSLAYDVSKPAYPEWAVLPYVNDPGFPQALQELIAHRGVAGIYTPNPVVWSYLHDLLKDMDSPVKLVNASPVHDEMSGYRAATAHARKTQATPLPIATHAGGKAPLAELQLAALFRHGNIIPGMCDDEKISALYEIARHCTRGDVVEIGSAWGKSAFILARLARLYEIGKTLCIDPWQSEYVTQNDDGGLVDNCIHQYDYDEALRVFEINLLPYSANDINYLRLPSVDAEQHYRQRRPVHSPSFGTTTYAGKVALLHIDGNHAYAAALADVTAWAGHVVSGGWIIIDDYIWPYGDGPQRAGDEFLNGNKDRISCAFVMGTALFLQLQ
ncbi:class I SAM-dependent methyltransferase [Janthinobacterium psychrotolerans]|uniref:class I SAM-dependent methyltransferase n=1 Tax=Janthinobacterium psychrotolerans TaxID=1747903 RepID=UPI001495479B|nr:class I SAM-dependent methyltransferase [Janthinobacterium psychrotolerans]